MRYDWRSYRKLDWNIEESALPAVQLEKDDSDGRDPVGVEDESESEADEDIDLEAPSVCDHIRD